MDTDTSEAIKIADIRMEGRVIRGDSERLSTSLALHGLRHPILLAPDNTLLSGYRRIDAATRLGWQIIGYRRAQHLEEACDIMRAERDGDPEAVPVTPYDMWVIGRRLEALPRDPSQRGTRPETRELIARAVGVAGSTYGRVRRMYNDAARQGHPDAMEAVRRLEAGESPAKVYDWLRTRGRVQQRYTADDIGMEGTPLAELGEPPHPRANSPRAAALRRAFVREMAKTGYTAEQIGERLQMSPEGVRRIAKKASIDIKADAVTARTRKNPVDSNAIVERAIEDLDAIKWSLSQVDVAMLDDERADGWAKDLSSFANQTARLVKAIRHRKDDQDGN